MPERKPVLPRAGLPDEARRMTALVRERTGIVPTEEQAMRSAIASADAARAAAGLLRGPFDDGVDAHWAVLHRLREDRS